MIVIVLAVGAAWCNALASVLQRSAARSAPDEDSLRLRLVAYLVRRPAWFGGIVFMVLSFALQASALSRGQLSTVQPVMVSELLFVLLVIAGWFHHPVGRREWLGAVAIVAGLGGFLAVATPSGGSIQPSWLALGLAGAGTLGVIFAAVSLSRRALSTGRAALLGVAAGTTFALTAALTKVFTSAVSAHGLWGAFAGWSPFALAVTGIGAVFLAENAFQAGPLTASQPALTIADPLVSVALGVGMFGDHLQTAAWAVVLELATFALMATGIVLIGRSRQLSGPVQPADGPRTAADSGRAGAGGGEARGSGGARSGGGGFEPDAAAGDGGRVHRDFEPSP